MKIVIDTNRIIAALIRDGTSRKILFNENFSFITLDHSLFEIYKYEDEICKKANITHEEFEILIALIFEKIEVIPKSDYISFINESKRLISDQDDAPFIAVSLAMKADGIWSDDKHFQQQTKVKIYKTEDMIRLI